MLLNSRGPILLKIDRWRHKLHGPRRHLRCLRRRNISGYGGANITLQFYGDMANQQGADNPTDHPGVLLTSFVDAATQSPQSFSHNPSGAFVDPDLHSLTLFATGTLNNGGTLVGRLQAIETLPVPEPASLMLFGSDLAGLGFFGRRYRKNTAA